MTRKPNTDDITPVLFRRARRKEPEGRAAEITAVFPCDPSTYDGQEMSCYAHIGQHGSCSRGWYNTTRAAKPEEYADLMRELESAPYHYRLKVYKRIQQWMDAERLAKARTYR